MIRNNRSDKNSKVNNLLSSMEKPVANSFIYKQRKALQKALVFKIGINIMLIYDLR